MGTWPTVARGIHQRRGDPFDISIVAVEGGDGLLVVDTGVEPAEGEEILADLDSRFDRPVRWVVDTHAHFDHTFGNQVFGPESATDAAIYGHATSPAISSASRVRGSPHGAPIAPGSPSDAGTACGSRPRRIRWSG